MAIVSDPGDVQQPPGVGAEMAIGEYWPSISESAIQAVVDEHRAAETRFSAYADLVRRKITMSLGLLEGKAGEARIARLTKMRDHAYDVADHVGSKAVTAESYRSIVVGLKLDLTRIGDAAQEAWETAQKTGNVFSVAPYNGEAASLFAVALEEIAKAPPVTPMPVGERDELPRPASQKTQKDEPTKENGDPEAKENVIAEEAPNKESGPVRLDRNNSEVSPPASAADAEEAGQTDRPVSEAAAQPFVAPGTDERPPASEAPATGLPSILARPPAAGTPFPSAGQGGAAGRRVPAGLSPLSGISPKDVATPPATMAEPLSRGPQSSVADNFQSGLVSGMGVSGAASSVPSVPPERIAARSLSEGLVASSAPHTSPPPAHGVTAAAPGTEALAGGSRVAAPVAPHLGGGALAPYVPPGGASGSVPPPAATSAAPSPHSAHQVVPTSQQGSGVAAPLVAGRSGADTTLREPGPSQDLVLACRILDGLVRGTNETPETFNGGWIEWAVSVLRTASGATHVAIASSVGGGVYVPAGVVLPFSVRIAAVDPLAPWAWARRFMGWGQPSALLVEHANAVCEGATGVQRSALVTTEAGARQPVSWADFAAVAPISILHSPGAAPALGGEYVHRLISVAAEIAGRLDTLAVEVRTRAATAITEAVVMAAEAEQSPTWLPKLIDPYDRDHVLEPLRRGAAVDWEAHAAHLSGRAGGSIVDPFLAACPLDLDDSDASHHARMLYAHHYRCGLLAEMIRYHRFDEPMAHDLAYCAVAAGFTQQVIEGLARLA